VKVVDSLSPVRAVVDDEAVAVVQASGARDLRSGEKQVAEHSAVAYAGFSDGANVLARHNENVRGSLGAYVGEGIDAVVLIDGCRGNFTGDDFAEDAAHRAIPE
jgi:hypothetical protein